MERRGSGLRKIVDEYPEDTVPTFRSREIKNLRDTGIIRRVGSDRLGHWEIIK